jgi:hypothetical protein
MKNSTHPTLCVPIWSEEQQKSFLKNQSVPITTPANLSETAIYRSPVSPHELLKGFPQIDTVQEMFANTVKHFGNRPFMGFRQPVAKDGKIAWGDYIFKSYKEVKDF